MDLIVEFLEDAYQEDPVLAMDVRKKYMGTDIAPTGDPLIDMWERQIAAGEVPDLDACEDPKTKARDKKMQEAAKRHYEETGERFYTPPTPVFIEQIEKMREEALPGDFDVENYHEEVLKKQNPFTKVYRPGMNRFDLEDSLQELPAGAFDEFINMAGLLKK